MNATPRGFTLLEVLVAISIFAIIGLGAYRLLITIIDTHERVRVVVDEMGELSQAVGRIERDLLQATLRPVRDEYGEPLPPFAAGTGTWPVEFTRAGWNNPAGLPRSTLQRVAYRVTDDGTLERLFWLVLDRAEDTEPRVQHLVSGVQDVRVNLWREDGEMTDMWPVDEATSGLPAAVEFIIVTETAGEVRRLVPLVSAPVQAVDPGPGDAGEEA